MRVGQQRNGLESGLEEGAHGTRQNEELGTARVGDAQSRVGADQRGPDVQGGGAGIGHLDG